MAEQTVRRSSSTSYQVCPFWLDAGQSCSLYEEGLFLPRREHIHLFCRHNNYLSCNHYAGSVRFVSRKPVVQNQDNKRRSRRVPIRVNLHLVNPDCEGVLQVIDDAAQTVDISGLGLRLESRAPMQLGVFIEFFLGRETASSPLLRGTGQVKWCHSLDNAPLYHTGIVFTDDTLAKALQNRFDIF